MKKPSALLAADLHIREDHPICRTDDFLQTIIRKTSIAKKICDKYNIPMLASGDIFEYWKNSPNLIRAFFESMPDIIAIPGQHDLPQHNLSLYSKSSLAAIEAAGHAIVIKEPGHIIKPDEYGWDIPNRFMVIGFPFGTDVNPYRRKKECPIICMTHQLVTMSKDPYPGANAPIAKTLLDKYPCYDVILSGDNHQQFTTTKDGRHLINPGSMTRQDADQIDHNPKFYLWYAEDNSIEIVDIPVDKSVVVRTHIETQKEKDDRIDKYIDSMNQNYEVKLNFKNNLNTHMKTNNTEKDVEQFIFKCLEG